MGMRKHEPGDGGGVSTWVHYNGTIAHNWILFTELESHAHDARRRLVVMGLGPEDNGLRRVNDVECPPQLTDGVGPNPSLKQCDYRQHRRKRQWRGIRLQHINGTDVQRNPKHPANWYQVTVTNNVIANTLPAGTGAASRPQCRPRQISATIGGVERHNVFGRSTLRRPAGPLFDRAAARRRPEFSA